MNSQLKAMRLGTPEFLAMNNPVRRWLQRNIELKMFKRLLEDNHVDLHGKSIVDAGCGSGYGTELIAGEFEPSRLVAFDLMPEQLRLATKRRVNAGLFTADMTKLCLADDTADAVFVFGVIHHIPAWKQALAELARVLHQGGVLLLEEPHMRFNWPELEKGIEAAGLDIVEWHPFWLGMFRSYLCRKNLAQHRRV